MTDTYDMVYITQCELQKLVREDGSGIGKAKETMVCEDCPQSHGPSMQNGLMAQTAETSMAVYDLDAFAYDNVAEDWEEREDSGKGGLAVDDEEGHVVDLEAVGEVAHTCSTGVGVRDDDDLVSTIDEFLGTVNGGAVK